MSVAPARQKRAAASPAGGSIAGGMAAGGGAAAAEAADMGGTTAIEIDGPGAYGRNAHDGGTTGRMEDHLLQIPDTNETCNVLYGITPQAGLMRFPPVAERKKCFSKNIFSFCHNSSFF